MTATQRQGASLLEHEALVYESDDEYLAALRPAIDASLDAGEPVMAVVSSARAATLESALGSRSRHVEFVAGDAWYRHPFQTVAAYADRLRAFGPERRPLVVGEVEFGDRAHEWAAWTRYEAALNEALAHHDARVVCPYDSRRLSPTVIHDARRTHPHLLCSDRREASPDFVEPTALLPTLPRVVELPDRTADVTLAVDGALPEVRRRFAAEARAAGLALADVDVLTVAVNEVVTNALVHGGGETWLRIWRHGHSSLTCEIEDTGSAAVDPLLGYRPPPPGAPRGNGMWLVRQLVPRSDVVRSPRGGLSVVLST